MERLTRGDLRRLLDAVRTLYASADLARTAAAIRALEAAEGTSWSASAP
jgi:hypothetical protein